MRRSHSTSSPEATPTPGGPELKATVNRLPSGRFRVAVNFGLHPLNGKPMRVCRTFDTENEAFIFRDSWLAAPSSCLANLRRQLEVDALPSPPGHPERRIYLVRGQQVMLDADVAQLFGTQTRLLNQAVNRNRARFPDDFAFHLTAEEFARVRSLDTVKAPRHGGRRTLPRVFTDLGLVMVSALLKLPAAVKLNLEVVRTVNDASNTPETQTSTESEE